MFNCICQSVFFTCLVSFYRTLSLFSCFRFDLFCFVGLLAHIHERLSLFMFIYFTECPVPFHVIITIIVHIKSTTLSLFLLFSSFIVFSSFFFSFFFRLSSSLLLFEPIFITLLHFVLFCWNARVCTRELLFLFFSSYLVHYVCFFSFNTLLKFLNGFCFCFLRFSPRLILSLTTLQYLVFSQSLCFCFL